MLKHVMVDSELHFYTFLLRCPRCIVSLIAKAVLFATSLQCWGLEIPLPWNTKTGSHKIKEPQFEQPLAQWKFASILHPDSFLPHYLQSIPTRIHRHTLQKYKYKLYNICLCLQKYMRALVLRQLYLHAPI